MPEVFRKYGYCFFFYSREHEPIHVHIEGEEGIVIFDLIDDEFVLREMKGKIKANSLRKIVDALDENKDLIVETWNKYFGDNN